MHAARRPFTAVSEIRRLSATARAERSSRTPTRRRGHKSALKN